MKALNEESANKKAVSAKAELSNEEKNKIAEAIKKETGAIKVFVDYRYNNRIVPFFSESQIEFFKYLLDTNSSLFDDIIKNNVCTKANEYLTFAELKSLYWYLVYDNNDDNF